jgi:hypothetical protein
VYHTVYPQSLALDHHTVAVNSPVAGWMYINVGTARAPMRMTNASVDAERRAGIVLKVNADPRLSPNARTRPANQALAQAFLQVSSAQLFAAPVRESHAMQQPKR